MTDIDKLFGKVVLALEDKNVLEQDRDTLRSMMRILRHLVDGKQREQNRTVSFGDYFFDRWEKADYLGFGNSTSIYDSALVFGDVTVGENTWIGPQTILDGSGGLTIGSFCSISAGVQIYSHDSVDWAISGGGAPIGYEATVIKDRYYVGPYTIVQKGITIGEGSVVGAHSLVNVDIPPGSKAYGTPLRVVD